MKNIARVLSLTLLALASPMVWGHTSEIFFAEANANNSENRPAANVLFLIDTSGSMCLYDNGGNTQDCSQPTSRMNALKAAFNTVIDGLDEKISVGVGKFNGGKDSSAFGGYVFAPVLEMNAENKVDVKDVVSGLTGTSNTPLMEAYSEMARYMLAMSPTAYAKEGEAISNTPSPAVNMEIVQQWNDCASRNKWGGCVGGNENVWVSDANYDSPINSNNQCESNHIIVMTDGEPTQDWDAEAVNNITGGACSTTRIERVWECNWQGKNCKWVDKELDDSYACQEALSAWLYNQGNDRSDSQKSIKTWQIAFGVDADSAQAHAMNTVAEKGGTKNARFASNAEELAQEFLNVLDLIDRDSRSISAPGVAVNQMSRLQHLGQLYYSVFQPAEVGVWQGNLKRYRLDGDMVVDAKGSDAVDSSTGYFKEGSKSFWNSASADDGDDATKGGAREHLANRNTSRRIFYSDAEGDIHELTDSHLADDLTAADLGIPAGESTTKAQVLARLRTLWADPLHSVPVLVNYDAVSVDEDNQENYVFVSTNGGMLHAIDTSDGNENYAFMPYEMLSQAYTFAFAPSLNFHNTRPVYGLDGSWVAWRRGNVAGSNQASKVYLYGGMRRGGQHYYALDVTDPSKPGGELLWKIGPEDGGFELLGQTWSTPTLIQLRIGGQSVPALVFGGGYSPLDHDKQCANANMCPVDTDGNLTEEADAEYCGTCSDRQVPSISNEDRMGRAVYIVNALTGDMIWSASRAASGAVGAAHTRVDAMKWAVTGSVAVVDTNLDGYADHLYFGDLGTQVFRVDLNASADTQSDLVRRVVPLAKFTEGGTSGARRFFEAPAVAYVEQNGERKLVLAIASGYRAHPLDRTIEERVYVIHDDTVFQASYDGYESPSTIGNNDLLDVTDLGNATDNNLAGKKGWYMNLDKDGEKAMASPTIFNGRLLLTSYSPNTGDQDPDPCKVRYGTSYLYVMNLMTSRPDALTNTGEVSDSRREELAAQTPVSQPQIIAQEGGKVAVLVGTEVFGDVDGGNMDLRKRRWYPLSKTAANEFVNGPEDGPEEAGEN